MILTLDNSQNPLQSIYNKISDSDLLIHFMEGLRSLFLNTPPKNIETYIYSS